MSKTRTATSPPGEGEPAGTVCGGGDEGGGGALTEGGSLCIYRGRVTVTMRT